MSKPWLYSAVQRVKTARIEILSLRILLLHACISVACIAAFVELPAEQAALFSAIVLLLYVVAYRKLDYLDPLVAFLLPWIAIVIFSVLPLSELAIPIHRPTYIVVTMAMLTAIAAAGRRIGNTRRVLPAPALLFSVSGAHQIFPFLDVAFWGFTALNVALAGYVPLVRGLTTGDTGYLEFGVHGLYGLYLAFANAFALLSFVAYVSTREKKYLLRYFGVLLVFVLFVTRQNLISTVIETLVAYSVLVTRISTRKVLVYLFCGLIAFSVVGEFRSGSIKEVAAVKHEYLWIPEPAIWLYSYSYFNIANVDNLVEYSQAPYYDGSSLASLIPSFLRPEYSSESYLASENFNVSSYLYPMYQDLGAVGVFVLTLLSFAGSALVLRRLQSNPSLFLVATYCVLYFCAAFSFFYNFWFFLPVVFQIVFFGVFQHLLARTRAMRKVPAT